LLQATSDIEKGIKGKFLENVESPYEKKKIMSTILKLFKNWWVKSRKLTRVCVGKRNNEKEIDMSVKNDVRVCDKKYDEDDRGTLGQNNSKRDYYDNNDNFSYKNNYNDSHVQNDKYQYNDNGNYNNNNYNNNNNHNYYYNSHNNNGDNKSNNINNRNNENNDDDHCYYTDDNNNEWGWYGVDLEIEKDGPEHTARYTGQRYKDNESDNSSDSEVDDEEEEGEDEDVDGCDGGEGGKKGGTNRQCVGDLVPSLDAMHLRTFSEPEHTQGSLKVRLLSVPSAALQAPGAGTGREGGGEAGGGTGTGGRVGTGTGSLTGVRTGSGTVTGGVGTGTGAVAGTGVGLTLHGDDSESKYQYLQIAASELVHHLGKVRYMSA
jgi:hypothetical protein